MNEVTIIARAKVKPEHEEDMQHALQTNAAASRGEQGCVSYSVLRGDGGTFMAVERWACQADADAHMSAPHVQTFLHTIAPYLAAPPEISVMREV